MLPEPTEEAVLRTDEEMPVRAAVAMPGTAGMTPVLPANSTEKRFSLQIHSPCRKGRLENIFVESHPNSQVSLLHLLQVGV